MQFSKNWLKDFVDIDISTEELCEQLTMAGLEVDGYESFESKITGKDAIIKLDITPNRGDCFSVLGVAREVAIANNLKFKLPNIKPINSSIESPKTITVCPEAPVYAGRFIRNINLSIKTDPLIAERLETSEHRLIDPVVDITNYILLELGQPLHAFDSDKLEGSLRVRFAKESEKLTLLDETSISLSKDCLVIADKKKSVAFAGIMGGLNSSVTSKTESVFLESAFFSPKVIRGKARRYGLQTDASVRFERGVDFNLQELAIKKASMLLSDSVGGNFGPIQLVSDKKNLPKKKKITVSLAKTNAVLGSSISKVRAKKYLTGLGLSPELKNEKISVLVPSWRYDIAIEADLIEELARLEGYDKLPKKSLNPIPINNSISPKEVASNFFVSLGYNEVITYSFIDQDDAGLVNKDSSSLKVSNPISQNMSVMRPSLWPGLLNTYINNLNNGNSSQKIFEVGSTFSLSKKGVVKETKKIAGLIAGNNTPMHWKGKNKIYDFYDLKGHVENLASMMKVKISFEEKTTPFLHPGKSAIIKLHNKKAGHIGALHPDIINVKGLKEETFLFSIDLDALHNDQSILYKKFSRFPASQRDLAFIVDQEVSNDEVMNLIKLQGGKDLVDLIIFDVYQGTGVPDNKKSLAYALKWQSKERTLIDVEVDGIVKKIVKSLFKELNATLRT
jgi:phenylalanyl-tRNA synthetase beta chain